MKVARACFGAILTTLSLSVTALEINAYLMSRDARDKETMSLLGTYLKGVGEGLSWANIALVMRGQPPLYCAPSQLALNPENYLRMLDDQIARTSAQWSDSEKKARFAKFTIEQFLTDAVIRTFPCKR